MARHGLSARPWRWLAAAPALASVVLGCSATMPPSIAHPLAGGSAPEFEGVSTSDRDVRVPGRGRTKVTVVGFWASWCATCQAAMPVLADLYRDKRTDGVMVVGVSLDESEGSATSMAHELDLSFPVMLDPGQRVATTYGVSQIPLTFVVDRGGRVRWVGRDPKQARQAALAVLAE
jgi:cytochrome c biogenesis protein CcmG, thiol:disulfide interchange protein DsbE